jgi:hypothetical protein
VIVISTSNITVDCVRALFTKLRDMINASVVKARLYDSGGNMVKEFTDVYELSVGVEEDYVFLYIRVVDLSNATYKFKWMHVIATDGTTSFVAVKHPFLNEYEKGVNQVVDIKVRTGVLGCVST